MEDSKISYKGSEFDHDYYDLKKGEYRKYSYWEGPEDTWKKWDSMDKRDKFEEDYGWIILLLICFFYGLFLFGLCYLVKTGIL